MAPLLIDKNGLKIYVYGREHLPPHIHAFAGNDEALINIKNGTTMAGSLPKKKLKQAVDWLNESNNREAAEQMFYVLNPRLKPRL